MAGQVPAIHCLDASDGAACRATLAIGSLRRCAWAAFTVARQGARLSNTVLMDGRDLPGHDDLFCDEELSLRVRYRARHRLVIFEYPQPVMAGQVPAIHCLDASDGAARRAILEIGSLRRCALATFTVARQGARLSNTVLMDGRDLPGHDDFFCNEELSLRVRYRARHRLVIFEYPQPVMTPQI